MYSARLYIVIGQGHLRLQSAELQWTVAIGLNFSGDEYLSCMCPESVLTWSKPSREFLVQIVKIMRDIFE